MRHTRFVFVVSMFAFVPAAIAMGCGSGSNTGGDPGNGTQTGGDGGGQTTGDGSPVSGGDSGGPLPPGCFDGGPADDRPACNACAYANCCKQIDDCANDFNCQAIQNCEAEAGTDQFALLLCQEAYDPTTLQAVGACATAKCATECPPPDAGLALDAF